MKEMNMAKTNEIIQAKGPSYMKDTVKKTSEEHKEVAKENTEEFSSKKATFKEVVCPKVPTSYFKRAKRQRNGK